jgi:glycosyltransferase involved in cell wall biosynthesis
MENTLKNNGIKLYKTPLYMGNAIQRCILLLRFRRKVKKILKQEYASDNTMLWLVHNEMAFLFASLLDKYNIVLHSLETYLQVRLGYKLLGVGVNIKEKLSHLTKVACCEYNRAQFTKVIFNLEKLPYVLPNKINTKVFEDKELPIDIQNKISQYQGKKIILYQGGFLPERKLDIYIESIQHLSDEYVIFLMGNENVIYNSLKRQYESARIVFIPFLPPPLHLKITALAHIGILTYIPNVRNIDQTINVLYCAPNKIYEYSKFGIPILSNDLPAIKWAFAQNRAGICIDELNVNAIISAINNIEREYEQYKQQSYKLYQEIDTTEIISHIIND